MLTSCLLYKDTQGKNLIHIKLLYVLGRTETHEQVAFTPSADVFIKILEQPSG